MKQRALSGFAASGLLCSLLCGAGFAACAGNATPAVSNDLADEIETTFSGAGGPAAGGAAATGNAGAAGADSNGDDSGGAAGAGGDSGGAAGSGDSGGAAGAGDSGGAAGSGDSGGAAGAAGGPDEGGAGAGGAVETCNGFAILAANCGSSGCHGEGSNLGTFAASEEEAREYIGQPGAVCSSQGSIIDTEDPASSLMVTKLSDDPPCAQPMPLGGQPLPQADIDCIEDWISGL